MLTSEEVLALPRRRGLRIGIGAGVDREGVENSAESASADGIAEVEVFYEAEPMVRALKEGRIDAAVRGTLPSGVTMTSLRDAFGLSQVLRMALLEPTGGRLFLFAPVGIDEGWTVEERLRLIVLGGRMARTLGVEPSVAVLSGGRFTDMGRNAVVDRTIEEAERVVSLAREAGFDAHHGEILIESAARDSDIVIAPEGISGNLIFRTLHFLGGAKALGAPVLNMERVFVDTSRAKRDFVDSIALAAVLVTASEEVE